LPRKKSKELQQTGNTEGESKRSFPARPIIRPTQVCTKNILMDFQSSMKSGGLHNVGQRNKEVSIVNNLTGPTGNPREKCSVDSMESSDEIDGM
jgi:hypothetical protein